MHPTQPGIITQTPLAKTDLFPLSPQQDNELVEWEKLRVLEALFGVNVDNFISFGVVRIFFSRKNFKAN